MSVVKDQYIMECCDSLRRLKSYIDDFAMIAGSDIACAENRPDDIKRALKGRNAVLVKGLGALCASNTKDDLEAVEMIVSKNAAAACYVRNAAPLSELSARVERSVYLTKYSKRKDEK
jgi:L-fuculose-phosphate aldolase